MNIFWLSFSSLNTWLSGSQSCRHCWGLCFKQLKSKFLSWDTKLDQVCFIDPNSIAIGFCCMCEWVFEILEQWVLCFVCFYPFSFKFHRDILGLTTDLWMCSWSWVSFLRCSSSSWLNLSGRRFLYSALNLS